MNFSTFKLGRLTAYWLFFTMVSAESVRKSFRYLNVLGRRSEGMSQEIGRKVNIGQPWIDRELMSRGKLSWPVIITLPWVTLHRPQLFAKRKPNILVAALFLGEIMKKQRSEPKGLLPSSFWRCQAKISYSSISPHNEKSKYIRASVVSILSGETLWAHHWHTPLGLVDSGTSSQFSEMNCTISPYMGQKP